MAERRIYSDWEHESIDDQMPFHLDRIILLRGGDFIHDWSWLHLNCRRHILDPIAGWRAELYGINLFIGVTKINWINALFGFERLGLSRLKYLLGDQQSVPGNSPQVRNLRFAFHVQR